MDYHWFINSMRNASVVSNYGMGITLVSYSIHLQTLVSVCVLCIVRAPAPPQERLVPGQMYIHKFSVW